MKIKSYLERFSFLISHFSFQKGFTLIELLVVVAVIGVLAAGILVAIDPVDKINQANDAKVQNDVSGMGRAAEAYAVTHNGFYPKESNDLLDAGELRRVPAAPSGYNAYVFTSLPSPCTAGTTCEFVTITSQLKSKRFTATPFWRYESSTGSSCAVNRVADLCPTPTPIPTLTPTLTPTPTRT